MVRIQRRQLLKGAGALYAMPFFAFAQAVRSKARVGILFQGSLTAAKHLLDVFKEEMTRSGWREGANIEYVFREGLNDFARIDRLAAELVSLNVDVIAASTAPTAIAARKHTSSIPIVFTLVPNPVATGLVASLGKPGGNATGTSTRFENLWGKRLQLLQDAVPSLRRVALMYDPSDAQDSDMVAGTLGAGRDLAIQVEPLAVRRAEDFKAWFSAARAANMEAVLVGSAVLFFMHRVNIADLAIEYRLPMLAPNVDAAEAGILLAYGINVRTLFRAAARYVDKILKGTKPQDLPVEQPTVLELVVNLKSAAAAGIKIPQSVLVRADRVIE